MHMHTGTFACRLPQQIKVSAVIAQIASPSTAAFARPIGAGGNNGVGGYPRVLFMPAEKDAEMVATP